MKKSLKIIGIWSLTLWFAYQQFCYANPVAVSPTVLLSPVAFFVGIVAVVLLVTSASSFLKLKKIKDEDLVDRDKQKIKSEKKTIFICIPIIILVLIFIIYIRSTL